MYGGYVVCEHVYMNVYMCVSFQWRNKGQPHACPMCTPHVHPQGMTRRLVWRNGAWEAGATEVMSWAQPRPVGWPRAWRGRTCPQSPLFQVGAQKYKGREWLDLEQLPSEL